MSVHGVVLDEPPNTKIGYLSCGSLSVPVVEGDSRMGNVLVISVLLVSQTGRPNNE